MVPTGFTMGCVNSLLGIFAKTCAAGANYVVHKQVQSMKEIIVTKSKCRVRQPRFFSRPGAVLRPYTQKEFDGPLLLAQIDFGRLRWSDDYIISEPVALMLNATTSGKSNVEEASLPIEFDHTLLVTNRRLLVVKHLEQEQRPSVRKVNEKSIVCEVLLFGVVLVDIEEFAVHTESDEIYQFSAEERASTTNLDSLSDDSQDNARYTINIVHLPHAASDMSHIDQASTDGFLLQHKQICCKNRQSAEMLVSNIRTQIHSFQPFVHEY